MDRSDKTRAALFGYFDRQRKAAMKPKRTRAKPNARPEKDLVERPCVAWMEARGWIGQVYESKAVFSNGRWKQPGMKAGHSDWAGMTAEAIGAFVEFKAPGKRATFWREGNEKQQDFILEKIKHGAFAVVVDSADLLAQTFFNWHRLKNTDAVSAKHYLLSALPHRPEKTQVSSSLFGEF